jgi:hypothetical protein
MKSDSTLRKRILEYSDTTCMSSGCWRGYVATWKIENETLYLVKMLNGCEDYDFRLENVFGAKNVENNKVFANWFSGDLYSSFGQHLYFDPLSWEDIYSKTIKCKVVKGNIKSINITEKSDCEKASILAQRDFEDSNYAFHSLELVPVENTYTHVLDKYYSIKWYFTDSLDYYNCYDSIMTFNLKAKYGSDFLNRAKVLADSLEQTENWISNAEYIGGDNELMKFILNRLTIDTTDMTDGIKTKLYIEVEIDSTGKVINPIIIRGISKETDKKVVEIINEMPKWKPAYLYGEPTSQKFYIPINIDYQ